MSEYNIQTVHTMEEALNKMTRDGLLVLAMALADVFDKTVTVLNLLR